MQTNARAHIAAMVGYSLYCSSLALLCAGSLAVLVDVISNTDLHLYQTVIPFNTLLLSMLAALVLMAAGIKSRRLLQATLGLMLVFGIVSFAGINISTWLPNVYQDKPLTALPRLQQVFWLVFIIGWLYRAFSHNRPAKKILIVCQCVLLLIVTVMVWLNTTLPAGAVLDNYVLMVANTTFLMLFITVGSGAAVFSSQVKLHQQWRSPINWLAGAVVIVTILLWLNFMHQIAANKQKVFADTTDKFEQQLSQILKEQYGLIYRLAERLMYPDKAVTSSRLKLEMQSYLRDYAHINYIAVVDNQGEIHFSHASDNVINHWFNNYILTPVNQLAENTLVTSVPKLSLSYDRKVEHTLLVALLPQPNVSKFRAVVASLDVATLLQGLMPIIVPAGYSMTVSYEDKQDAVFSGLDAKAGYLLIDSKQINLLNQLSWQLTLFRDMEAEINDTRQISQVVLFSGWLATILALIGAQYQHLIQRQHMRLAVGNERLRHSLNAQKKLQLQHRQILANSADMICLVDAQSRFIEVSESCKLILGYEAEELIGRSFLDFTLPEDKVITEHETEQIVHFGKIVQNFRNRYVRKDGQIVHLMWAANYVKSASTLYAVARNVDEMVRAEQYQQEQQAVLKLISTEQPVTDIFHRICQMAESQSKKIRASLRLKSGDKLLLMAAPSFSQRFCTAMANLPIADNQGSCGSAAYQKSLVVADDIASDRKWQGIADSLLAEGVKACWSMPMVSKEEVVLGTFALYCTEARSIRKDELELMLTCSRFAAVAIERSEQKRLLQQSEQRYRSLYQFNPEPVYIVNTEGYFSDMNEAGCQLLDYSLAQLTSMHFDRIVLPAHLARVQQHFISALAGNAERFETSVLTRTGSQLELSITLVPARVDGAISGIIGMAKDITQRLLAEQQLRLFKRAVDATSNGILIADILKPDMPIIYANSAFEKLTGYSAAEVLGRNCRFLQGQRSDTIELGQIRQAIADRQECSVVLKNYRKDNSLFWNNLFLAPVPDDNGDITHYIGVQNDITAQKQYERELAYNTSHDLLTGLPNRGLFQDRLTQVCNISSRHGQKVAVLFIALDGFKLINDSLGHLTGDEVLKLVSNRILMQTQPGDTLARIGGDEFVLLLPDLQDETSLQNFAQHILSVISDSASVNGQRIQITASIGISLSGSEVAEPMQIVQQADLAMYRAKQLGRNNYQWYTPDMDITLNKRLNLKSLLKNALENNEFELYYQPQVDAVSAKLTGIEALLRWPHPELGFISPEEFIPVAEDTGLIVELGQWVIEQACAFNYALQQHGVSTLPVAVNLSTLQFQRNDFIAQLKQILAEKKLEPRYLELELTESLLLDNIEHVIEKLHQLKQLGIRIAIDDFGTGYSSLNYLKMLPIDKLKIDRSFIRDIVSDKRDAAICRAIIAMAHQLDINVVAEGVETAAQAALLRKSLCDEFQGYHFARPMSALDTESFLRQYESKSDVTAHDADSAQTLLLVDDEDNILHALKRALRKEPYTVLTCTSAKQAFELLALHDVQVIVSDQRMPQISGTEFLSQVKDMYPDTVRLVLSGYTDLRSVTEAINRGAIYKFLTKPWHDEELRSEIGTAFKRYAEQAQKRKTES